MVNGTGGWNHRTFVPLGAAMLALGALLSIRIHLPLHGSMEAQAAAQRLPARNHLRYGLSKTRGLANFSPGGLSPEEFAHRWWINHPPLVPLYTAGIFSLFGDSMVVTRLSGIVLAVLALPLVIWIGARLDSPRAGAWAGLLYSAAGLTLWDAQRPEYFQPSLLLLLIAFGGFLSWLERPNWRSGVVVAVTLSLGCLVDWMCYIFGATLAAYLLVRDWRRGWPPALLFASVLIASFALFYAHVRWVVGSGSGEYLTDLLAKRSMGHSRIAALATQAKACVTHIGVIATLAGLAALWVGRRTLHPRARGPLWLLAAYGLAASQFFVGWTVFHSYVAAWFVFPFLVLAGGMVLSRVPGLLAAPKARFAAVAGLIVLIAGQGVGTLIYRCRQDTWYRPDREFIAIVKESIPPGSCAATPIRGLYEPLVVDETDVDIRWDTVRQADLQAILERAGALYVLLPKPGASQGFWSELSGAKREDYGIRPLEPGAAGFLSRGRRRDLGAYELYRLERRP